MSFAFKTAFQQIESNRIKSEKLLKERQEQIYALIPRVKEIDKEIFKTGASLAKLVLKKSSFDELERLRKLNEDLNNEKSEILKQNGYESSFFEDIYVCSSCNDTGFINGKKCSCLTQKIIDKYYEMSNLSNILAIQNFDAFNMEYYSEEIIEKFGRSPRANMEYIYTRSLKFVEDFGNSVFSNLFFYGHTGLGKTFLSNCIAKDILDKGHSVIYVTSGQLFSFVDDFRFNKDEGQSSVKLNILMNSDLLIIDDLGTEFNTKIVQSELFNILNTRILNKKSTIISTNIPLKELEEHYHRRIFSRIIGEYLSFHFIGRDIRILKKRMHR